MDGCGLLVSYTAEQEETSHFRGLLIRCHDDGKGWAIPTNSKLYSFLLSRMTHSNENKKRCLLSQFLVVAVVTIVVSDVLLVIGGCCAGHGPPAKLCATDRGPPALIPRAVPNAAD